MATSAQIQYARRLLRDAGLPTEEDKREQVLIHSDGRTDSLKAMHQSEVQSLIDAFKNALGHPTDTPAQKMQRKIISLAHEMGWHLPGTRKVNMARINEWSLTKSGFKKPFKQLNYLELPKAVSVFEKLYTAHLKAF